MDNMLLAQLRTYKLIALVTTTLLVGALIGFMMGDAGAQAVTRVQLDTSNCVSGEMRANTYTELATLMSDGLPSGAFVVAITNDRQGNGYVYVLKFRIKKG